MSMVWSQIWCRKANEQDARCDKMIYKPQDGLKTLN